MSNRPRTPLIAGNWKMHKITSEATQLAKELRERLDGRAGADVVLCPPFTALAPVRAALRGSTLELGAQDVHWEARGAFTGAISAAMLLDLACRWAIIGHSERRQYFGDTDETVARKVRAALKAGLKPILCVGETWSEREAGSTDIVVKKQLTAALEGLSAEDVAGLAIAYEPIWAIGTGRAATGADAAQVTALLRAETARLISPAASATMRILYGGSVTPANMAEFMEQPDVDGALVGGASLQAESFTGIVGAALAVRA